MPHRIAYQLLLLLFPLSFLLLVLGKWRRWRRRQHQVADARQRLGGGSGAPRGSSLTVRRVLLPTRGGDNAGFGAEIASRLARGCGAEVTALYVAPRRAVRASAHVWRGGPSAACAGSGSASPPEGAGEVMRGILATGARLNVHWRVRMAAGRPVAAILNEADRGYDLLVLGASERGRTRDFLFGSIVDSLLQVAPCPMLVVRAGRRRTSNGDIRRVLLPTLGRGGDARAAALAFAIAAAAGAELTALHVVEARRRESGTQHQVEFGCHTVDRLVAWGADAGVTVEGRVLVARAAGPEIIRLAVAGDFDLVVMCANPKFAGRRVFYGQTVGYLLDHPVCPLALLNAAAPTDALAMPSAAF